MLTLSTSWNIMTISKEVDTMKKAFNTSIDEEILQKFRDKCKEENFPINIVLEKFMEGYIEGRFNFRMEYSDNNGK